jgi:type I restriction enzyme S subunit
MCDFILTKLVKTGTTVQSLKYSEFENQLFPLPPLAEQHRIVAKVDELMAICDELEAQLINTSTTRRQLLESTLKEVLFPQDQP